MITPGLAALSGCPGGLFRSVVPASFRQPIFLARLFSSVRRSTHRPAGPVSPDERSRNVQKQQIAQRFYFSMEASKSLCLLNLSWIIGLPTITITWGQLPRGKQNPLAADHAITASAAAELMPKQNAGVRLPPLPPSHR